MGDLQQVNEGLQLSQGFSDLNHSSLQAPQYKRVRGPLLAKELSLRLDFCSVTTFELVEICERHRVKPRRVLERGLDLWSKSNRAEMNAILNSVQDDFVYAPYAYNAVFDRPPK